MGEALLHPHVCYYPAIREAMKRNIPLDGIAHITGGGLYDNVPRILPGNVDVIFRSDVMPVPPIFKLLTSMGKVEKSEAYRVFNMGIGMVWFVPAGAVDASLEVIRGAGFAADVVGEVVSGSRRVEVL